MIFL
ncbi:uncharacterized protein FRV6_09699 [Fusarium oxysporum]|jgi:hypothetical protein